MWWIKATINEYILRSWSIVKVGSSAAQKKLFFNLRKLKNQIAGNEMRALHGDEISEIATTLNVSEGDVVSMEGRMSGGDSSLNKRISHDGDATEIGDMLEDNRPSQEIIAINESDYNYKKRLFMEALDSLTQREREILQKRRLLEPPKTLKTLSGEYGISRERIRQIENKAITKLQAYISTKHITPPSTS